LLRPTALVIEGPAAVAAPMTTLSDLKRMSVEKRMNLQTTSVVRRPDRFADAPAAVTAITRDQIRRSGATPSTVATSQISSRGRPAPLVRPGNRS
jgi:hypothetical protein